MLVLMGPLVGVSFINAVRSYAEASGKGGAGAGLADALFPLGGVIAPTFSAYEIAASFLLPFVAICAIGGDRASGTLKLELQGGMAPLSMIGAKALVLGTGWLLAGVPIMLAGILWISYGGSLYVPEVASLVVGHSLNAGLVIALAAAAAALALDRGDPGTRLHGWDLGVRFHCDLSGRHLGTDRELYAFGNVADVPARLSTARSHPRDAGLDRGRTGDGRIMDTTGSAGAAPRHGIARHSLRGLCAEFRRILRAIELGYLGK
jgi:hypothetical protein